METIRTGVLVIGGGLAGLMAALTAREAGLDVMLVSKTPLGVGNCSAMSGGSFRCAHGHFPRETHLQQTLQAGRGLNNRRLVELFIEEAPWRVPGLRRYGVELQEHGHGYFSPGPPWAEGANITRPLAQAARRLGIGLKSSFLACGILKAGGQAARAWGYDSQRGEFQCIRSGAVVLASGGGGAIYTRTSNPIHATGDGYAIAHRCGVPLQDMEFVQFYPVGAALPHAPARNIFPSAVEAGKLLNSQGEDLLQKYAITERPACLRARDVLSRCLSQEVAEGRGIDGAIILDVRGASEEKWQEGIEDSGRAEVERRLAMEKLYHLSQRPLPVLPLAHFFCGGMVAGENGETSLPGLFAAGEVAASIHGTNRLGGNALSEAVVFGARAGQTAAAFAASQGIPELTTARIDQEYEDWLGQQRQARPDTIGVAQVKSRVRELIWQEAGVIRSEPGLKRGLKELKACRESLALPDAREPALMVDYIETDNIILAGQMVMESALRRQESRGGHFRQDYPQPDDRRWLHSLTIQGSPLRVTPGPSG